VAETRTNEGYGGGRDYLESSGSVAGTSCQSVLDAVDDDSESVLGYKITESMIRVGQPVFVHGTVQRSARSRRSARATAFYRQLQDGGGALEEVPAATRPCSTPSPPSWAIAAS